MESDTSSDDSSNSNSEEKEETDDESSSFSSDATGSTQEPEPLNKYGEAVREWTQLVPIGLGLCPWAITSQRKRRINYIACEKSIPSEIAMEIQSQIKAICQGGTPLLTTTLLICPHVEMWQNDFEAFDQFVKTLRDTFYEKEEDREILQEVTLVSFHPEFLRWRGLPEGIDIGTNVQSHKPIGGFQKSQELFPATILETSCKAFGRRKIRVQFLQDDSRNHYVPTDWCQFQGDHNNKLGPPLPDNAMHRAPYPTVHIIRNQDLASLRIRDVSRVKRKNAQRMTKLGWDGVHAAYKGKG